MRAIESTRPDGDWRMNHAKVKPLSNPANEVLRPGPVLGDSRVWIKIMLHVNETPRNQADVCDQEKDQADPKHRDPPALVKEIVF
jgi:hypothetical protein